MREFILMNHVHYGWCLYITTWYEYQKNEVGHFLEELVSFLRGLNKFSWEKKHVFIGKVQIGPLWCSWDSPSLICAVSTKWQRLWRLGQVLQIRQGRRRLWTWQAHQRKLPRITRMPLSAKNSPPISLLTSFVFEQMGIERYFTQTWEEFYPSRALTSGVHCVRLTWTATLYRQKRNLW